MIAQFIRKLAIVFIICFSSMGVHAQSVSFALKTSPNINFNFNTIQKYTTGITIMNACELNIDVTGTQWDLYVGSTTTAAGFWDVVSTYSLTGAPPPISILELQFRNGSNTSQISGFFSLQDILTPNYIIGSLVAPDAAIACPNIGTNQAGDYLTTPNCYKFNVDLRITPGLSYQSGLYSLRIDYILVQDL